MAPNAVLAPIAPRTPIAPGASNAPAVAVLAATTGAHVAPRVPASPDAPLASDASETTLADAHDMLMLGQYDEAAKVYAALTADPRQATAASIGLARCWIQTGRYDDAITALHDARAPDNADWHAALAAVLTRTGRYEDVLRHAESAVRLDPGHTDARLVLGRTLELLGRRDEAIATYRWFDRQIAGRPELPRDAVWITNTAVGFLRYSVLTRTNVTRRVKHVLEEMLQVAYERLDRSWWPARIAAADLLRERFNNDEHDGSVSDYKAALRINGNLPEAHVGLGEVALDAWDFDEVERRAALALGINPNFSPAIRLLAKNLL
ncbi:MAG: tetratricopeptide repeat protein, partial [Phycisphaerae bacterium]